METAECERCGLEKNEEWMETVSIIDGWYLCEACRHQLNDSVEFYDWQDRYTREHHERAIEILSDIEEVECIISSYEDGAIVVHTPYVSSPVIEDVRQFFNFEIVEFGPRWENDGTWPCVDHHGSVFEIVLEYNHHCQAPQSVDAIYEPHHIDRLDDNDKQFE